MLLLQQHQNWINKGYTRAKMESAVTWEMGLFAGAFPKTPVALEADPCSLPAIDDNGHFFSSSGNCGDTQAVTDLVNHATAIFGKNLTLQNDGLQTYPYIELSSFWNLMETDNSTMSIGFQFAWPVGINNFSGITQTGIDDGAKFIEFYESDLTNPLNANEISSAHAQLLANYSVGSRVGFVFRTHRSTSNYKTIKRVNPIYVRLCRACRAT